MHTNFMSLLCMSLKKISIALNCKSKLFSSHFNRTYSFIISQISPVVEEFSDIHTDSRNIYTKIKFNAIKINDLSNILSLKCWN